MKRLFCKRGHSIAEVGRYKHGGCRACGQARVNAWKAAHRPPAKRRYVPPSSTHCVNGHEIAAVGRYPDGNCKECHRERVRRYKARNREHLRQEARLDRAYRLQVFGDRRRKEFRNV